MELMAAEAFHDLKHFHQVTAVRADEDDVHDVPENRLLV
jgi:hypothetical protein